MPAVEEVKKRINAMQQHNDARELQLLLHALIDGIRAVTAKLDADATVTQTDFTASFDAQITK